MAGHTGNSALLPFPRRMTTCSHYSQPCVGVQHRHRRTHHRATEG